MFPTPVFLAYLLASVILAATPGPGVFYIVARSVVHGRTAALASVAGVAVGNALNMVGACLGVGAVFLASATAFTVLKYAGAAYLVWLGIEALRGLRRPPAQTPAVPVRPNLRVFLDGMLVAGLNPKTALFFAAFLPQFLSTDGSVMAQSLMLGSLFVAIAAVTDTVYACLAVFLASRLTLGDAVARLGRVFSGVSLIGLGVVAAVAEPPRRVTP